MSERVIVCAQCQNSWNEPLFVHECHATPRIARSIDDLRVGQVVATHDGYATGNVVTVGTLPGMWAEYFGGQYKSFTVVILADAPPAADWLVPGEAMEALREATDRFENPDYVGNRWVHYVDAVTAVLDAAREVERDE